MEKLGLNPKWFEPGLDGKSPFVKAYRKAIDEGLLVGHSISAAFRVLLAEDAQQSECGKVVQVPEAVSSNVAAFIRSKDDEIAKLRAEVERLTAELRACADERMAAEIERDAADEFVKRVTAERDAERARVEALCEVIYDANGAAYPFGDMQNKMTTILEGRNAHAQGDEG